MGTVSEASTWGQVGRVREIVDGHRIYIEAPNGNVLWADMPDAANFSPGQVVLALNDRIESAPAALWYEEPFISVVRIKNVDTTVLEFVGPPRSIPTNDVSYEVGYTVEALSSGVVRVLDTKPLSLVVLPEVSDEAVESFIVKNTSEIGDLNDFGGLPEVTQHARKLIETPLKYADQLKRNWRTSS